jgi:IS4 transposase
MGALAWSIAEPAPLERRRHQRVKVRLAGRFMRSDRLEFDCESVDASPGGIAFSSEAGLLFATADGFPTALEIDVAAAPRQPRAPDARVRTARVAVSFGKATIARPKTGLAAGDPEACEINVVVARERDVPLGTTPLMWRLLTTSPVETAEDAREIIRLYRLRWRIEEVFRVLKPTAWLWKRRRSRARGACSTSLPSPWSRRRESFNSPTPGTRAPAPQPT